MPTGRGAEDEELVEGARVVALGGHGANPGARLAMTWPVAARATLSSYAALFATAFSYALVNEGPGMGVPTCDLGGMMNKRQKGLRYKA